MTESIAPDTAGKLATSPKPATSGPPLKTPDKPETVGKTESATKLSPTSETPKSAPETLIPLSGGISRSPLGHVGHKRQAAIIASALFSLIAGIAGVRLMWPATDTTQSAQTPNQTIPGDPKQTPASTAGTGIPVTATPPSENFLSNGLSIPMVPTTVIAKPVVQQQYPAPPTPARFKLTDKAFVDLKNVSVPGAVLEKLALLKNLEFSQEDFEKELAKALIPDDYAHFQFTILIYAKETEKTAPVPLITDTPNTSVQTKPPTNKQLARFEITDQVITALVQDKVPGTVLSKLTPLKYKELTQEDMEKEITRVLTAEEKNQNQNYILYYARVTNPPSTLTGGAGSQLGYGVSPLAPPPPFINTTIATPTPSFTNPSVMPPPSIPTVFPVGPQIIAPARFDAPSSPATSTPQPPPPTMPAVPAVPPTPSPMVPSIPVGPPSIPTAPTALPPPSFGSGQPNPVPGVVIPLPPGDMNPKPPTPVPPAVGLPGTPVVGTPSIPTHNGSGTVPPIPPVVPEPSPVVLPVFPPSNPGSGVGTTGTGAPIQSKPPASPPVTPVAAIERSPTTSYDVDLYELKANDTWETISQEFYNDKRYAAALKAANNNKPLTAAGWVDIPPIYILKQKSQNPTGTRTPIGQTSPLPSSTANWSPSVSTTPTAPIGQTSPPPSPPPSWTPSTSTTPATAPGDGKIYKVPPGGISMRAIARNFLGNDQRWTEIYNLNPQLKPDSIPEGTDVRLPADARLPN